VTDERSLQAGADRFSGFAALYDDVRPTPPDELGAMLAAYVGGRPSLVVDLGCGTGSSSRWAAGWSDHVVGVEPSDDMRAVASASVPPGVEVRPGWSHETGLASGAADVVLAVQSLHWMEPATTFAEVARLLRPGGVFAAVDCDWPPSVGSAEAEAAWERCMRTMIHVASRQAGGATGAARAAPVDPQELARLDYSADDVHRDRSHAGALRSWSKAGHLGGMAASGRFAWCREVVVHRVDRGDADRFVRLLQSQGDYQALRRSGLDDTTLGVDELRRTAEGALGDGSRPWWFTYRARLGFAPPA
jgi:SAM-dependent methyltransferase